jgi:hypothetical protein
MGNKRDDPEKKNSLNSSENSNSTKKTSISSEKITPKYQSFPFILKNTYLAAGIDPKTSRFFLEFKRVKLKSKKKEFSNKYERIDFPKCMQSNDIKKPEIMKLQEVQDIFTEYRNWVKQLAEKGWNNFHLLEESDNLSIGYVQVLCFLFKNLIQTDSSFIQKYLDVIQKESDINAPNYKIRLHNSLDFIIHTFMMNIFSLFMFPTDHITGLIQVLEKKKENKERYACLEYFGKVAEIDSDYIFHYKSASNSLFQPDKMRVILAPRPELVKFKEYLEFFTDKNYAIRAAVASNPQAVDFKEYLKLFYDPNFSVRRSVMMNPRSKKYSECNLLFPSAWGDNLKEILKRPDAANYTEYKWLFLDESAQILATLAADENAMKFPEYRIFFTHPYPLVREAVVRNPKSMQFPEYVNFISDSVTIIRIIAADNPISIKFPEYLNLFHDENESVRQIVAKNPNVVQFPEYRNLFHDISEWVRQRVAQNPNAVQFPEYRELFHDVSDHVRAGVAYNVNAPKFEEFRELLKEKSVYIRSGAEKNPGAAKFKN